MASLSQLGKKFFKFAKKVDPLGYKIRKNTEDLPGGSGAAQAAFLSDQPSDPYGKQQGKFDIFAGGKKLSESKRARNVGRAVGTVAALYFGAGAAGGSETAAGAGATTGGTTAAAGGGTAAGAGTTTTAGSLLTTKNALTAAQLLAAAQAAKKPEEPGAPEPEELPQAPSFESAAAILEAARTQDAISGGKRRRGRAASILTGTEGAGLPNTAVKRLLGE